MVIRACHPNGRICAVGDDKQNIYFFAGSLHNSMELFKEKLNAREFSLTNCYSCPKKVISMAQLLVPDIKAADFAKDGELVTMSLDKALDEVKVNDAVLSRTNSALVKVCLVNCIEHWVRLK